MIYGVKKGKLDQKVIFREEPAAKEMIQNNTLLINLIYVIQNLKKY